MNLMILRISIFGLAIAVFSEFAGTGGLTLLRAEPSQEDLLLPGMEKGIQGDYQGAIAEFTAVIRRYPQEPEAYYNRGIARSKIGDRQGAMEDYNQAILLNSNFAEAYAERGLLYWELGNRPSTVADWQKAAELFWNQKNYSAYQQIINKIDGLQRDNY